MITVLVPTRGRPDDAWAVLDTFEATRTLSHTRLVFVIDEGDPAWEEYHKGRNSRWLTVIHPEHSGGMVAALNAGADATIRNWPREDIVGFIGDDHRFRSKGWDQAIADRLKESPGFAYGNDLAQGGNLATQCFVNAKIVQALGWFGLPDCYHLYIDNAWMELGRAVDRLHYLPDVVIEHMHPAFGKSDWDEGHLRVNTSAMYDRDREAFTQWRNSPRFEEDVARVRHALGLP